MSEEFPPELVESVARKLAYCYQIEDGYGEASAENAAKGEMYRNFIRTSIAVLRASKHAELMAALKLARIPFAASLPRRSDRDEAQRELAQIDTALSAAPAEHSTGDVQAQAERPPSMRDNFSDDEIAAAFREVASLRAALEQAVEAITPPWNEQKEAAVKRARAAVGQPR